MVPVSLSAPRTYIEDVHHAPVVCVFVVFHHIVTAASSKQRAQKPSRQASKQAKHAKSQQRASGCEQRLGLLSLRGDHISEEVAVEL